MDRSPHFDGGSARSLAQDLAPSQWSARPVVAFAIRIAVFVVPLAASWMATRAYARMVDRPAGLTPTVLYWVVAIGVATATMFTIDRVARQFLPLATMFRLSLVFPDQAPSRFKTALRTGTAAQLQRRLLAEEEDVPPGESAALLLALVTKLGRHDRRTRGHSERVRAYSDLIAEEMDLPDADRQKLHWAALLHDVGKLVVPYEILNKTDRPTDDEWEVLRRHPAAAPPLLTGLQAWLGPWVLAASEHHERFDGDGYPNGLAGTDISLGGRIVAVADAFDVMTSTRSYKKAQSPAAARAELAANAGSHFDPVVVRAFLNVGIGRLRFAMGPLTGVAELIGLSQVPATAGAAALTAVVGVASAGPAPAATPSEPVAAVAAPVETTTTAPTRRFVFPELRFPTTTTTTAPTTVVVDSEPPGTTALPPPTTTLDEPSPFIPPPPPPTTSAPPPPTTVPSPPTTVAPTGPTGVDDAASVEEESVVRIDVLANDLAGSSPLDPQTLRIVIPPSAAERVSITTDYRIRYVAAEWIGLDRLQYEICDTAGSCDTAMVVVTVFED